MPVRTILVESHAFQACSIVLSGFESHRGYFIKLFILVAGRQQIGGIRSTGYSGNLCHVLLAGNLESSAHTRTNFP